MKYRIIMSVLVVVVFGFLFMSFSGLENPSTTQESSAPASSGESTPSFSGIGK